MELGKLWHLAYGTAFAVLLMGVVAVAVAHPHALLGAAQAGVVDFVSLSGLPIWLVMFAGFTLLEAAAVPAGPRKPARGYRLNLNLTILQYLAAYGLGAIISVSIVEYGNRVGLGIFDVRFSTGHRGWDLLGAFLLSTFIFDFFFYWYHRFQHESVLWQEHKLHHMDETLCAVSRTSWLEVFIQGPLLTLPMAVLFKLNPVQGAISSALFAGWAVFVHANIRLHLGPLALLFNAPQGHRIHHSRLHEHHDHNYAGFFPVLDVLFGTFHYPKRDEYPPPGVHDEVDVTNFWKAVLLPLRAWYTLLTSKLHRKLDSSPHGPWTG